MKEYIVILHNLLHAINKDSGIKMANSMTTTDQSQPDSRT